MSNRQVFDTNRRDVHVKIPDDDIKQQLISQVLREEGMLDQHGEPLSGVSAKCIRDNRGFKVIVSHDRSHQKLIEGAKP